MREARGPAGEGYIRECKETKLLGKLKLATGAGGLGVLWGCGCGERGVGGLRERTFARACVCARALYTCNVVSGCLRVCVSAFLRVCVPACLRACVRKRACA